MCYPVADSFYTLFMRFFGFITCRYSVYCSVFHLSESGSLSVVPDSLQPHGLYSPWNSPVRNTGVGCHALLQGIFPTQVSRVVGGFFTSWPTREAHSILVIFHSSFTCAVWWILELFYFGAIRNVSLWVCVLSFQWARATASDSLV